jgi:hypothetical protein
MTDVLGPSTPRGAAAGSGAIAADVLSEIGVPGQAARIARSAAAHGSASSVRLPPSS